MTGRAGATPGRGQIDPGRAAEIAGIERSTNRTWPAAKRLHGASWSLQASGGWTRRANSATVYGPMAAEDVAPTLTMWERWYAGHRLPAMVRTSPLTPDGLVAELDRRGYTHEDGAIVMQQRLPTPSHTPGPVVRRSQPDDDWWSVFSADERRPIDRAALEQLWASTGLSSVYPVRMDAGRPVAVGMAVRDDARAAIFNMRTRIGDRGRGHASALLADMLVWAAQEGCTSTYLQVAADNHRARSLYHRMGFEVVYEYGYRVQRRGARDESV